jgi:hypothetical protein
MALVKCSECKNEISDQAVSCPKCGNPVREVGVKLETNPEKPLDVNVEFTSKKWKRVKMGGWITIALGFLSGGFFADMQKGGEFIGFSIIFLGVIILFVGKIGAWYNDKQAR